MDIADRDMCMSMLLILIWLHRSGLAFAEDDPVLLTEGNV
jgi:hypothetical protein